MKRISSALFTFGFSIALLASGADAITVTFPGNNQGIALTPYGDGFRAYGNAAGTAGIFTGTSTEQSFTPTVPAGSWSASTLWGASSDGSYAVGYTTNSTGRFDPFWVNATGVAQAIATPSGGHGQLFGVTNTGEAAGIAGLPVGGNVNTGLAFLPVPAGTGGGTAFAVAVAPSGEILRAGNRVDITANGFTSLWINSTQYDLPAQSNFTSAFGISENGDLVFGFDNGFLSYWSIDVANAGFSQFLPTNSLGELVAGIFRDGLSNGLAWGRCDGLGACVYDPFFGHVYSLIEWSTLAGLDLGLSTNPVDLWSMSLSLGNLAIAYPNSLDIFIGPAPAHLQFEAGTSVPEPATIALLLFGGALGAFRRVRKEQ